MPGLEDVAFLRSPVAHARIRSIGKPAEAGGRIFTAADLAGVGPIVTRSSIPGYKLSAYPPLAVGKVRFVGEPVAMACATTRAAAEDLCELVTFEYEELPPVLDSEAGRSAGAALVHEEWGDNLFLETFFDSGVDAIARIAPVVVEREFRTARQCMHPMEGKGVLAYWDFQADQLVVTTSTQVPHLIRTGLAECLRLDQERLRVIAPDVGGGFGYKCLLQLEELCIAWLAMTFRRPFRWIEDRREHLTAGANARQHHYRIKAYADARGRLLGMDAEVAVDTGAYSVWPFTACLEAAQAGGNLPGPYDFRGYRCRTYSVATNKPPFAPYRGVARPGVCFAMELTIDAIARAVGREPADVRAENLVPAGAMPYTNVTQKHYDSGDYPGSLHAVRAMIGLEGVRERQKRGEPDGRLVGVGFATYTEQSAHGTKVFASWGLPLVPGYEQAMVKLTPDGGVDYNISDADLRSIVATFRSVFPGGTVWMIGEEDLLLVASNGPLDPLLSNIASNWKQPGVARDLASVSVREPFSILSLFVGGPSELGAYTQGASVFTDDRSALEFSAPKELHTEGASANASNLAALLEHGGGPDVVRQSRAQATAGNWHNRAVMMFKSDMFATAFADEMKALDIDPADEDALNGIVDAAVMTGRYPEAMRRLTPVEGRPKSSAAMVARAKLLAATGSRDDAVMVAKDASTLAPGRPEPLEALAAIYADTGNAAELDRTVAALERVAPAKASTALLRGGFGVSSRQVFRRRRAHQDRNRVRSVVRRRVRSRRRRRSEAGARRGGAGGV